MVPESAQAEHITVETSRIGACPGHGELHPVLDWLVLGLAGTPDIAGLDCMLEQRGSVRIDDAHDAVARDHRQNRGAPEHGQQHRHRRHLLEIHVAA